MSERFHKAAKDGYLRPLQRATKRDCNAPDDAGMTPTACAAFEGRLEALRLIVSRGGDPDKCDHFGNTSLHCAAARGHLACVTFLVNFGANPFLLDNQYHSAKDLAAVAEKQEVLRFLDSVVAQRTSKDPSGVKKLQEKAEKEVVKRLEKSDKLQKKLDKRREDEQKLLDKEREMLEKAEREEAAAPEPRRKSLMATISRGSLAFIRPRKDSKQLYSSQLPSLASHTASHNPSPTFSDLTANAAAKRNATSIQKKIFNRKVLQDVQNNRNLRNNDFKVREGEGGTSVRTLTGLRRDSEIILVPDASLGASAMSGGAKHTKLSDVFDGASKEGVYSSMGARTLSVPDFGNVSAMQSKGSIFDRPGFGSVAFRNTITGTFGGLGGAMTGMAGLGEEDEEEEEGEEAEVRNRLGNGDLSTSTGSLLHSSISPFEEEDLPSEDEAEAEEALTLFLAGLGLAAYASAFKAQDVDLEALRLLTEDDLKGLGLPLGPRRKILLATRERRAAA